MRIKVFTLILSLGAAVLLAAGSPLGWAAKVRYEYSSGLLSPSGGVLTGYVTFDASRRLPGFISALNFSDWRFAWGSDFIYAPATHSFDPNFGAPVGLFLQSDLSVGYSSFCVSRDGHCATTAASHPVLLLGGYTPNIQTFATTSSSSGIGECCSGVWSKGTVIVDIDIKPGDFPNSINLGSKGVVPMAILSSSGFNAMNVDVYTVTFAGASPERFAYEDVNSDGVYDLLLHFRTEDLRLTTLSTQGTLIGKLRDGGAITGADSVQIVPPKPRAGNE